MQDALEIARELHRAGRLTEAVAAYHQAVAADPRNPETHFALGVALAAQERFPAAEAAYRRAVSMSPEHLPSLVNLSVVLFDLRHLEESAALCEQVVARRADWDQAHVNLGNVRLLQEQFAEARDQFQQAAALQPSAAVLSSLAYALGRLGDWDGADAACRQARALAPDDARVFVKLSKAMVDAGRLDAAESLLQDAVAEFPHEPELWHALARVRSERGRQDEAIAALQTVLHLRPHDAGARVRLSQLFLARGDTTAANAALHGLAETPPASDRDRGFAVKVLAGAGLRDEALRLLAVWRSESPGHPIAEHLWSACSGEMSTMTASADFVRQEFDEFAATFDATLERLRYRGPELIRAALARHCGEANGQLDVLDAGCGTGLIGAELRPFAKQLVGVDLSREMLDRAAKRGLYDVLAAAELRRFLERCPAQFDLIVSADTFVYFGDLSSVFAATARALRPGGRFVFTVECLSEAEPFRLRLNGRYAHGQAYVEQTLAEHGFRLASCERETLRHERGEPVVGLVVAAELPGRPAPRQEADFALLMMSQTVASRPNDPRAHFEYGLLCSRFARHEEAAASFRRVIELRPDVAVAHFNLGNSLFALGQHDAAAAAFRQANAIAPDADAWNNLGNSLASLGRMEDARAAWEEALRLNPELTSARNNLVRSNG